jgi:hypothetical protein
MIMHNVELQLGSSNFIFEPEEKLHIGFADAKPSESIQKHELPGLAVAVLFLKHPRHLILDVPVRQYKEYNQRKKGEIANQLSKWLIDHKKEGLEISGMVHAHTQIDAAFYGLDLLEEIPKISIEKHFSTYILNFDKNKIDLSQAVALQYYLLTLQFGSLRAGLQFNPNVRNLFIEMDRFPGKDTNKTIPGRKIPQSQGNKFLDFIQKETATGIGIDNQNASKGLKISWGTLDWWRVEACEKWRPGKNHPNFVLTDWLVCATIAHEFREEFIAQFQKNEYGIAAADGLSELYKTFKSFDIWSIGSNVLSYIKATEKLCNIPDEARKFIIERAQR